MRGVSWSFRETEESLAKQLQEQGKLFADERYLQRVLRSFAISYVIKVSFSICSRNISEDIFSSPLESDLCFSKR